MNKFLHGISNTFAWMETMNDVSEIGWFTTKKSPITKTLVAAVIFIHGGMKTRFTFLYKKKNDKRVTFFITFQIFVKTNWSQLNIRYYCMKFSSNKTPQISLSFFSIKINILFCSIEYWIVTKLCYPNGFVFIFRCYVIVKYIDLSKYEICANVHPPV